MPDSNATSPGPAPRRLRTLPGATLAAIALLAAAEILTRLFLLGPAAPSTYTPYGWVEEPHSRLVYSREGYSITRRNSLGFDDAEPLAEPRRRILLLGDSYGQSHQVSREEGFAARLEAALPGVDVLNTSRSGQSPIDYATYLPALDARFPADVVLLQVNDGDLAPILEAARAGLDPAEAVERFRRRDRAREDASGPRRWAKDLAERSALANLSLNRLLLLAGREERRLKDKLGPGEAHASAGDAPGDPIPPAAAEFLDGLYAMIRAETEAPILFVYIPNLVYSSEGCRNKWPERRRFWLEFAERRGVPLVDCTEALCAVYREDRQPAHGFQNSVMGTGHINARGHEAVAGLLVEALGKPAP